MSTRRFKIEPSKSEGKARIYAAALRTHIEKNEGRFLRDDEGGFHFVLNGRRVPINFDRDNTALAGLMMNTCGISTISQPAQAAIQWLQVEAAEKAARLKLRRFSAMSPDGRCLYIPLMDGKLLRITAERIDTVANGDDGLWVESIR